MTEPILESQSPLSKTEITDKVRARFAQFNHEIISLVLEFALRPKRMRHLLKALRLESDRDFDRQLDAVFFYLVRQTDKRNFISRLRNEIMADARASEMANLLRLPERKSPQPNPSPTPIPSEPILKSAEPAPAAADAPLAPVAIALPVEESKPEEIADLPERAWISVPSYDGPDRRVGPTCRRTQQERRQNLLSVMVNHRFGGDRRKNPLGRRNSDRSKPAK